MARGGARCPKCAAQYSWGVTVCPTCHVGLEFAAVQREDRCTTPVFESWDRPSVDVVVSLLEAHGVPCLVRGTHNIIHFGIGPANFWRVFVRASDEALVQDVLDAEIGREDAE